MRVTRHGNISIQVALFTVLILAVGAFAVDFPYLQVVQLELDDAAEAGAHAGAAQFDWTSAGMASAQNTAMTLARANPVLGGQQPVVEADDIEIGVWDRDASTFVASTDPDVANAVRVTASRPDVGLFFAAAAFGRSTQALDATRIAAVELEGAGAVDCMLPFAMPSCLVDLHTVDGLQDVLLKINPPGIDNFGLARPHAAPNVNWARDQLRSCTQSGEVAVGEEVGLQNGVDTPVLTEIVAQLDASDTRWSDPRWGAQPSRLGGSLVSSTTWGKTLEGPVIVFDGGPGFCQGTGGQFNGTQVVTGFVWGAIFDVAGGNATQRTVHMRLDTLDRHAMGTQGGGPDYGITWKSPPRSVASVY